MSSQDFTGIFQSVSLLLAVRAEREFSSTHPPLKKATVFFDMTEIASEISGLDDQESPYAVLFIKNKSAFETQCNLIRQKIQGWETRQMIPKAESDDALKILKELGNIHQSLKSQTDALSGQIIQLQHLLALESKSRIETESMLLERISQQESEITQLKRERICERELMLIRSLATSFQYALTQKFPGLFTTLFPYACTFNDISKKVSKQSNDTFNTTLQAVTNIFISRGTDAEDINPLIKIIRELGTSSSHVTKLIDENGNQRKPSAQELLEIIDRSPLRPEIRGAARTLLVALEFVVPPGEDLLYCATTL